MWICSDFLSESLKQGIANSFFCFFRIPSRKLKKDSVVDSLARFYSIGMNIELQRLNAC